MIHQRPARTADFREPAIIIPMAGLVDCYGDIQSDYRLTASVDSGARADNDSGFGGKLLVVSKIYPKVISNNIVLHYA